MHGNLLSSIALYDGQPTWLSISIIVLTLTIAYATLQLKLDPLGHVPGPLVARFTKLWYARQARIGRFHMKDVELHKTYGSVVRIGPQEYSIDDPNSVKTLYGIGSKFYKADWYYASSSPHFEHLNLFALRDPEKHSSLKKKLARFYTMTYVVNYEEAVDRNVFIFCERLQAFSQKGETFDLGHWVQCLAFDVISEITFGRPFGFLEKGEDIDNLVESLEGVQKYSAVAGVFPWLHYIITVVLKYDPTAIIPRFAIKQIQQRQELGPPKHTETPNDFLTTFLELVENNDGAGQFSPEHIVASCGMNVTAGSDTTGISLASVFYYLAKHPESGRKVLDEVESTFPDRDNSRCLTFKETQALPYLQAVVKEALRLHPATGLPLARKVPKGGVSILGTFFHEGSVVGINPWVAHRNRDVFGQDADDFRPERWIEADVDTAKSMERYWIPFGSGSRTCIGKNISMLEISKTVPEILQRFDIHLVETSEQMFHQTECDWFVKPKALFVTVKGRSQA